jgi:hypothetical protein
MADILIDVEVKGNQKVVAAVSSTKSLESNVKALSDAMTKGSLSQRQYYKGISQLAESSGKSEKQLRDYATALRRVEKESKAAKAAQDRERESVKAYTQARREATAANQRYDAELKRKAKSEEESTRAAAKHAAQIEQVKNKYVPLYAASKQYERAIEELNQAYAQGGLTQSQYLAGMENIDRQLASNRVSAVGNTRSMNAMGMATQQVGYQVGDFLVQVQSGTNAMVAFGQQATQLVGVLPMMAEQFGMNVNRLIRISAVLGIAIPLVTAIGAAWMRTREANDQASSSIKTLNDELQSLNNTLEDWVRGKKAASMGLTVEELIGGQGIDAARKALEEARTGLVPGQAESLRIAESRGFAGLQDIKNRFAYETEETRAYIEALETVLTLERKIADDRAEFSREESKSLQQRIAVQRLAAQFGMESLAVRRLENQQELENYEVELRKKGLTEDRIKQFVEMLRTLQLVTQEAEDFEAVVESTDLSSLTAQAGMLAANMGVAASEARKYNAALNKQAGIPDNTGKPHLGFGITGQDPAVSAGVGFARLGFGDLDKTPVRSRTELPTPSSGSSGGSSGSAAKEQEDYVGKLLAEAEQKQKLIGLTEEETRRQEILYQLKEKGLPTDDKRIEQIVQMEAETRKLMEAEQQREQLMQTVTSNIESAFMSVVDGSKSVEDAFRSMLRNIILAVYQQQVAQPAATAIGNLAGKIFNFEGGGFTGYGPRSGGLDGKGGMMAMVHPNETVVDHTKGQSMGSVVVNNNFNIAANGDESVKRIIRGEVPRITEATKSAVLDAKRRGGSYGRSF